MLERFSWTHGNARPVVKAILRPRTACTSAQSSPSWFIDAALYRRYERLQLAAPAVAAPGFAQGVHQDVSNGDKPRMLKPSFQKDLAQLDGSGEGTSIKRDNQFGSLGVSRGDAFSCNAIVS
eukprot:4534296-Amphidinium_carterae.2